MKFLVIGSGGREHALACSLSDEGQVWVYPGNDGMNFNKPSLPSGSVEEVIDWCKKTAIDLVVIGPDQALADGWVDQMKVAGLFVFGPAQQAAKIEWSKAYAKEVMTAANIPTAKAVSFDDLAAAQKFVETVPWGNGWVVKADGLALGKGVVVCENQAQAKEVLCSFFSGLHGQAGKKVLIEERLIGRELSFFALADGKTAVPLGLACDYKRIYDGDRGPNTGGMGAYSPVDWVTPDFSPLVLEKIVLPLIAEMQNRCPFSGVVFAGIMVTDQGPKVIEFNARFGDPETQAVLPLLDEPLGPWLLACAKGTLHLQPAAGPKKKKSYSVHIVLAAEGYPVNPIKGDSIQLPAGFEDSTRVFFAGVKRQSDGVYHTNGGRVMGVTSLGETQVIARANAQAAVQRIHFRGMQWRSDVGR